MINKIKYGRYWVEAGGITVFFCKVRESKFLGAGYELVGKGGAVVAVLFSCDKGFKARVGELKKFGLIK